VVAIEAAVTLRSDRAWVGPEKYLAGHRASGSHIANREPDPSAMVEHRLAEGIVPGPVVVEPMAIHPEQDVTSLESHRGRQAATVDEGHTFTDALKIEALEPESWQVVIGLRHNARGGTEYASLICLSLGRRSDGNQDKRRNSSKRETAGHVQVSFDHRAGCP